MPRLCGNGVRHRSRANRDLGREGAEVVDGGGEEGVAQVEQARLRFDGKALVETARADQSLAFELTRGGAAPSRTQSRDIAPERSQNDRGAGSEGRGGGAFWARRSTRPSPVVP